VNEVVNEEGGEISISYISKLQFCIAKQKALPQSRMAKLISLPNYSRLGGNREVLRNLYEIAKLCEVE
jgi:hypothetical protein